MTKNYQAIIMPVKANTTMSAKNPQAAASSADM